MTKKLHCNGHNFEVVPGFYVINPYAGEDAVVSGPFGSEDLADADLQKRNTNEEDWEVYEVEA